MKILANDGIDDKGKFLLEQAGFKVETQNVPQDKLIDFLNTEKFSALTVRSATKVRKDLIDACPGLKLIARGGVGMDNIDVEYALKKGISVVNTPAASSYSVAELVMAHLFSMVRFLYDSNREMPVNGAANFQVLKKKYALGSELRGKTLGIIGFGRIGQAVAKYAIGIGMSIKAYDPFCKSAEVILEFYNGSTHSIKVQTVSIEEVLNLSDFITLHVPGGEIIGKKEFSIMKQGVAIVNTARGGVINEKDLVEALNAGFVSHAALDVFENEPAPNEELLKHPKISLTPHIGAATNEAQERIGVELAEKIIEILKN
ncbi:MAG: D-2-hydroxyacid dehydrogenase [Bacteroidetes bacterium]|nr:D-2-hydroxyacid dehydrogenase [Bacteroidota bacterium]HET6244087.1 D-2-hydroxyacid dehydrogenase [Bacteroidia bacterium]